MSNYYKNQLKSLDSSGLKVQFFSDTNDTKTLNINNQSIKEIISFLEGIQKLSLYQKVKMFNIEFDTHCSDLYLFVTDETQDLINDYEFKSNVTTFKSAIDGRLMFDIPFAYEDYKR